MSGELWFYHLEQSSLEEVLPELLEKTLSRGWRALVRAADDDRLKALDASLWTWREDSFTPHGRASDDHADRQPVLLTTEDANANDAQCLFLLDGVVPVDVGAFERTIVLFDGQDESAVQAARRLWKREAGEGRPVSYWRQSPDGGWEKKA
jgi:DNA polymerase-3 subunit chi